jgi:hypothetical protein
MPTLSVDDAVLGITDIGLGPIWYLNEQGFSAAEGDLVEVVAYPCELCSLAAVAASVSNLSNGTTLSLRDAEGYPLWAGGQGGGRGRNGNGYGGGQGGQGGGNGGGRGQGGGGSCGWTGPDMSAVATVTGTVVSFTFEPGAGTPELVLATGSGELSLVASPYRVLAASGLELVPDQQLSVTYAPVSWDDVEHLVIISITDLASNVTVQLRDPETGFPVAGGARRGRHGQGRW